MEQPNMSYINELSGGDKAFEEKIIAIIKAEFPVEKDTYFSNLNENNLKATAESVHKLKHKISILGLQNSYTIAVDYENNLIDNKTLGKVEFETILQNITTFLKTI